MNKLQKLHDAGVDNWEGYDIAVEQYLEDFPDGDTNDETFLAYLEGAGVDNWDGYEDAMYED